MLLNLSRFARVIEGRARRRNPQNNEGSFNRNFSTICRPDAPFWNVTTNGDERCNRSISFDSCKSVLSASSAVGFCFWAPKHASLARKSPEGRLRDFAGFIPCFPGVQSGSTLVKIHAPQIAQAAIRAHPCEKEAGDGNFIVHCM